MPGPPAAGPRSTTATSSAVDRKNKGSATPVDNRSIKDVVLGFMRQLLIHLISRSSGPFPTPTRDRTGREAVKLRMLKVNHERLETHQREPGLPREPFHEPKQRLGRLGRSHWPIPCIAL